LYQRVVDDYIVAVLQIERELVDRVVADPSIIVRPVEIDRIY
jgi:hypothetical protein